jgi:TetR/AcrR family transcriptional repressor of lmrAB and yxaGH operons
MTEPTKGERTKKKLVDATAALLRRQGYHATGLSAIVDESGAPRGSVYFYFPGGKDELAVAAIEASGIEWRARIEAAIANAKDLGSAIDAIVKVLADDLAASNWQNGCPVAAVALESTSDVVNAAVVKHYATWQETITERLTQLGIAKSAAAHLATVALSAIEGALLLARVQRSKTPLISVGAALRAMVSVIGKPEPSTKRGRRS